MVKERFKGKGPKGKEKPTKGAPVSKKKKIVPEGVRGIVRIVETDVDGTKNLKSALLKIKGVGPSLVMAVTRSLGMDPHTITGTLTDEQLSKIEAAVRDPAKIGVPGHMLNRKADPAEGKDRHLVASTLTITRKFDIDAMKKIRCYKGIRHEIGLPVRGQRTRGSFRTGMRVGVSRAKVQAKAPKGAPAAAPKEAKAAATTPAAPAAGAPPTKEAAKKVEAKKEEKK